MNIFDLSGNNYYKEIREQYFPDTQVLFLCYPCDSKNAFEILENMHREFAANVPEKDRSRILKIIIGCKKDLQIRDNLLIQSDLEKFATSKGFLYFLTSSKNNSGVDSVFECLLKHIATHFLK